MNQTLYREHCVGTLCPWYKFEGHEDVAEQPMMRAICRITGGILFDMYDKGQFVEAILLQTPCESPSVLSNLDS